jgi:hypothetical protein
MSSGPEERMRQAGGTTYRYSPENGQREPRPQGEGADIHRPEERAFFDPWEEPKPADWPGGILSQETEQAFAAISLRDGVDYGAQCSAYVGAASAAAPKNVRFFPYDDASWSVPPILWLLLLNESGQRKTRILNTALAPLRDMHDTRWGKYMDELHAWRGLSDEGRRSKAKPSEPHSLFVNDATAEALQLILAHNHRGTALIKDELAALFEFGRYSNSGKGVAERAFFLESYEAGTYAVHRVGRDNLHIKVNGLTIIGGIQPSRMEVFNGLESDGLLQRFNAVLAGPSAIARAGIKVSASCIFEDPIRRLVKLPGGVTYTTTSEGSDLIRRSERDGADFAAITDYGPGFQGYCNKLHGTHARAALLLHLLDDPEQLIIPPETVARARKLVRRYFLRHARNFYVTIPGSNAATLRDIGGFLLTKANPRILASDLTHGVKACRPLGSREISNVLDPFVTGGWLDPETSFPSNRAWLLHPDVRLKFAERTKSEAERRADIRSRIGRLDDE